MVAVPNRGADDAELYLRLTRKLSLQDHARLIVYMHYLFVRKRAVQFGFHALKLLYHDDIVLVTGLVASILSFLLTREIIHGAEAFAVWVSLCFVFRVFAPSGAKPVHNTR